MPTAGMRKERSGRAQASKHVEKVMPKKIEERGGKVNGRIEPNGEGLRLIGGKKRSKH